MDRSPDVRQDELLARADLARSRLSATLRILDQRRREVFNLPLQMTKRLAGNLGVATVVVVCASGLVTLGIYRVVTARRRRRRERWLMVKRAWVHPERTLRPKETALGKLARALLVGAVRVVATRLLAELVKKAVVSPQLTTGHADLGARDE